MSVDIELTTEQKLEILQDIADSLGGRYRDDYSGRCMYGKTCPGITVDGDENEVIEEAGARGIRGARTDSMGRGVIVYWPGITTKPKQEDE